MYRQGLLALRAILILWDLLILLAILHNLLLQRATPSKPAPTSKTSPRRLTLKGLINGTAFISVLVHIAWSVDSTSDLGIYSPQLDLFFAAGQYALGYFALASFFYAWMYVLFTDSSYTEEQAFRFSVRLLFLFCVLPSIPAIACIILFATGNLRGLELSLNVYTGVTAVSIGLMIFSSSYICKRACKHLLSVNMEKSNQRVRILVIRQIIMILVFVSVLIVLILMQIFNVVKLAVYTPGEVPAFMAIIAAVVAALGWSAAPIVTFVPSVYKKKSHATESLSKGISSPKSKETLLSKEHFFPSGPLRPEERLSFEKSPESSRGRKQMKSEKESSIPLGKSGEKSVYKTRHGGSSKMVLSRESKRMKELTYVKSPPLSPLSQKDTLKLDDSGIIQLQPPEKRFSTPKLPLSGSGISKQENIDPEHRFSSPEVPALDESGSHNIGLESKVPEIALSEIAPPESRFSTPSPSVSLSATTTIEIPAVDYKTH